MILRLCNCPAKQIANRVSGPASHAGDNKQAIVPSPGTCEVSVLRGVWELPAGDNQPGFLSCDEQGCQIGSCAHANRVRLVPPTFECSDQLTSECRVIIRDCRDGLRGEARILG